VVFLTGTGVPVENLSFVIIITGLIDRLRRIGMREVFDSAIQVVFILAGFVLAFWLLYYALKSPKKYQRTDIDPSDLETKGKFIGRT
jgi:energy-coupling factor transporter transmembrane protein EcfT